VGHRRHDLAARVRIAAGRAVAHEGLAGERVLAFGQSCKLVVEDFAVQAPLPGELAVPATANLVGGRVVVLVRITEFVRVIRARLGGAQRLRDGQHVDVLRLSIASGDAPGACRRPHTLGSTLGFIGSVPIVWRA
jgi:hypothetical protein